jgi:hypothetical protein
MTYVRKKPEYAPVAASTPVLTELNNYLILQRLVPFAANRGATADAQRVAG